jgi:FixJ family two-component response regulator
MTNSDIKCFVRVVNLEGVLDITEEGRVKTTKASVLIVDDEQDIRELLCDSLSEEGYLCSTIPKGQDALTKLKTESFSVVLLDIRLPDISGMEILTAIHSLHLDTAVIMLTCINSLDLAVEAMKCGAVDYIVKPFTLDKITSSIQKALENAKPLQGIGRRETADSSREQPEESYKEMDAIAFGVRARHDFTLGFSDVVIRETIAIAAQLEIPANVIQSWAEARLKRYSEKKSTIASLLNKLERSVPAQEVFGLMRPYKYPLHSDMPQN